MKVGILQHGNMVARNFHQSNFCGCLADEGQAIIFPWLGFISANQSESMSKDSCMAVFLKDQ